MIAHRKNAGFSMIEVLITIVIMMIGLLGLAGLQSKALTAQMESYQRSQALVLLRDMESRINANRKNAASYITTLPISGVPRTCPAAGGTTVSDDLHEWCDALLGAAETQAGENVGAMIGALGCVELDPNPAAGAIAASSVLISVAWQGFNATAAPALTCGQNEYGANDALRRVVALPVDMAKLVD